MNLRRFFSRDVPETEIAPDGIPTWIVESDGQVRERLFVERVTRYVRLAAWLLGLMTVILFLSMAMSTASVKFGIVSPSPSHNGGGAGAKELFSRSWDGSGRVRLNEHP